MQVTDDGCLKDYKKNQTQLSREEFAKQFDHPWLVFDKELGSDGAKEMEFNTMCVQRGQLASLMGQSLMRTASSKVVKLVKKGSNVFQGMINIGRAPNCDVVIDSPAVSKFHAYFAKDIMGGSQYLSDANSTNGTFVNNVKLEAHGKQNLSDGDTISFGRQVNLSFYTSEGYYDLLAQIPG